MTITTLPLCPFCIHGEGGHFRNPDNGFCRVCQGDGAATRDRILIFLEAAPKPRTEAQRRERAALLSTLGT